MMESTAKASTKYLEELSILLRSQGFVVHPRETRDIDVELDGSTLCRINDLGNLGYFADKIAGKESILDRIRETARSTREYMTLLEQAPPLVAEGLSEGYQLLAEFNGTVLAGHMTRYGAQFVTWEWVHNKTALWQGHFICLTLATTEQSDTLLLPASEEQLEKAKEALEIDDFSQAVIAGVKYYDTASYLDHLIPTDCITVEDANELALCLREMKEEDGGLMKFCAVLEAEQPDTFAEALNIAMDQDDYECVPEYLAKYAEQNFRLAGAGDEILNMLEGYTDFDGLGEAIAKEDGVRRTEFGLVRRLSEPFPAEKQKQSPKMGGV